MTSEAHLATKADLATLKRDLTALIHTIEKRSLAIIGAMLGLAVIVIKWV